MTTAILSQVQGLNLSEKSVLAHQDIMAPSVPSQDKPRARHGRGKHGGSVGRARAVSDVNAREVQISKALTWILRKGQGEKAEEDGIDIEFNEEGWADCGEVVSFPAYSPDRHPLI
jgi:2'-phosphotransferase